jgi:hypothetical protein
VRAAVACVSVAAVAVPAMALAQNIPLSVPFGSTNSVTGLPQYIATGYRFLVGIVAIVATIMVVYGGFRYLIGSATEDVKTGKEIITDAIIGMIIVLGAYVILYTVNPATLTLQMPALPKIKRVEYGLNIAPPSNTYGGRRQCSFDSQCAAVPAGANTQAVPEGKCLLIRNPAEQGLGHFSSEDTSGGICSTGNAGSLCGCSGSGCGLNTQERMNAATNFNRTNSTVASSTNNNFKMTFACQPGLDCIPSTRTEQNFASEYVLPYCMRSGAQTGEEFWRLYASYQGPKSPDCRQDSECPGKINAQRAAQGLPTYAESALSDWKCYPVGNRGPHRDSMTSPRGDERGLCWKFCDSDSDCSAGGGHCMARYFGIDNAIAALQGTQAGVQAGHILGVCSFAGVMGEQCFCTGIGCSAPRAEFINALSHSCASGLACLPVKNNEPIIQHGLGPQSDMSAVQSLNWDALCLPDRLLPAPVVTGKCEFTCGKPPEGSTTFPSQSVTVDRNITCEGDSQTTADRQCWDKATRYTDPAAHCDTLFGAGYQHECQLPANANTPACRNGFGATRCVPNPTPPAAPTPPASP